MRGLSPSLADWEPILRVNFVGTVLLLDAFVRQAVRGSVAICIGSWATKWFITSTFHDQHHRYFSYNYGGYTTIWDRICRTIRPKFEADFDKLKARLDEPREPTPLPARSQ
jgi:sterol desaturase/sphingolipid hydroxylase (fatty acid hydroxylase superfamily)